MSVIVRNEEGQLLLLSKGADRSDALRLLSFWTTFIFKLWLNDFIVNFMSLV